MTRRGAAFALRMWEHHTAGSESSSWLICQRQEPSWSTFNRETKRRLFRTPLVSDAHGAQPLEKRASRGRQIGLNDQVVTHFRLTTIR